jgi:hypothetical protein
MLFRRASREPSRIRCLASEPRPPAVWRLATSRTELQVFDRAVRAFLSSTIEGRLASMEKLVRCMSKMIPSRSSAIAATRVEEALVKTWSIADRQTGNEMRNHGAH